MEKYLREIEVSGLVLVVAGIVFSLFGVGLAEWFCGIGMLLWLVTFLYRAFHWNEYERENKQNISILLINVTGMYSAFPLKTPNMYTVTQLTATVAILLLV